MMPLMSEDQTMVVRDNNSGEPKAHRRPHRKSKNGCGNCKRRRVKCDETKPACTRCINFSIHCNFTPAPQPTESPPSTVSHASSPSECFAPVPARRRGRPRKNWASIPDSSAPSDTSNSPHTLIHTPSDVSEDTIPCQEFNVADIELLHHYLTVTYSSLASANEPVETMWRTNVIQIGYSHLFVLHLVHGFSAFHLAYLRPDRREHYIALADHHLSIGLPAASQLIPHLDAYNCQALYIAAILVCLCTFARGPSPGDFLVFSVHGPALWLPLLRGVRSIVETIGHDVVFSGLLSPMIQGSSVVTQPLAAQEQRPRVDWEEPMHELRQFVLSSSSSEGNTCIRALDDLLQSFEATHGRSDGTYQGDSKNQVVMRWLYLYCVQDNFILELQRKQPIALLIVAHFAVLLKLLDKCWFLDGWMEHIITGVHGFLDEEHRVWLRWPIEQVGLGERLEPTDMGR